MQKLTKMSQNGNGNHKSNGKYVPGDMTSFINQHPSRSVLYTKQSSEELTENIRDANTILGADMNKLSLEPINGNGKPNNSKKSSRNNSRMSHRGSESPRQQKLRQRNEAAFTAAFHNFETARKMAQDNLLHQPLPDAILDEKFIKSQADGDRFPGLALDVKPISTGIGYKGYKVGPTQCTKLRVYRPKTCGVIPKHLDKSTMSENNKELREQLKSVGPMDLAIRWEYRPKKEPKLPRRIDGSDDVVPAVFTRVTPTKPDKENIPQFERAEGVFHNTMGEIDFFDRDLILKRKSYQKEFEKERPCTCGTSVASFDNVPGFESVANPNRPKTSKSDSLSNRRNSDQRRCKSSPNLSEIGVPNDEQAMMSQEKDDIRKIPVHHMPRETEHAKIVRRQPKFAHQMIPRLCHQMRHDYEKMMKKYFLAQEVVKDENNNTLQSVLTAPVLTRNKQVVYVPRQKQPYKKKNYQIDSLAPPFSSWTGASGQTEYYPDSWRLASIYQHAYKPVDKRKRPLLQSVYR